MSGSSLESKQTWGSVNRGAEHGFQQITGTEAAVPTPEHCLLTHTKGSCK